MEAQPQLEFSIQRIQDCGFLVDEVVDTDKSDILLGYGMDFRFHVEENWMRYLIKIDFTDANTKTVFLSGTVLTIFHIKDFKSIYDKENKRVSFPKDFSETLFGIAFSHARAIINKNAQGSRYASFIVPLINPIKVFNDLVKLNFEVVEDTSKQPVNLGKTEPEQLPQ